MPSHLLPPSYLAIPPSPEEEVSRKMSEKKPLLTRYLQFLLCLGFLVTLCIRWRFGDSFHMNTEKAKEFVIVTGASANHFCPLQGFLYSLHDSLGFLPTTVRARVIVYDLGLTHEQRQQLSGIQMEGYFQEIRTFNYTKYPKFWNITQNRGEYAWKVGILKEVADMGLGVTLWMDSGNRVFPNFLLDVMDWIELKGFYSPTSSGDVRRWTHPKLFEYFQDDLEKYGDKPNCNGALIGFNSNQPMILDTLINPLFHCALNQSCIAPKGSNRLNHRQDQAALTYLALSNNRRCSYEGLTGLLIHQDSDCKLQIQGHKRRQKKSPFSSV